MFVLLKNSITVQEWDGLSIEGWIVKMNQKYMFYLLKYVLNDTAVKISDFRFWDWSNF